MLEEVQICIASLCLSLYLCDWHFTHLWLLVCSFRFRIRVCDYCLQVQISTSDFYFSSFHFGAV